MVVIINISFVKYQWLVKAANFTYVLHGDIPNFVCILYTFIESCNKVIQNELKTQVGFTCFTMLHKTCPAGHLSPRNKKIQLIGYCYGVKDFCSELKLSEKNIQNSSLCVSAFGLFFNKKGNNAPSSFHGFKLASLRWILISLVSLKTI